MAGDNLKKKGVTLIELVAAMAIASIIAFSTYIIYSTEQRIYDTNMRQLSMQNSARIIFQELNTNINAAQTAAPISIINNSVTVGTDSFTNLTDCTGLLYVKLTADASNPFIYVIKNNSLYKIYKDGSGTNNPIANYISNSTRADIPTDLSNLIRIKLNLVNGNNTKAYMTFVSSGGS